MSYAEEHRFGGNTLPRRFGRGAPVTACAQSRVDDLVEERQAMRGRGAGKAELEANRLKLGKAVRDVGDAAIRSHRTPVQP